MTLDNMAHRPFLERIPPEVNASKALRRTRGITPSHSGRRQAGRSSAQASATTWAESPQWLCFPTVQEGIFALHG
jgi:hypothetical protein